MTTLAPEVRTLSVSIIERAEEMASLETIWRRLQERCPGLTVFSTWEWCSTVARHYATAVPLWLITVWDGGEPVGLAPLALRNRNGLRTLVLLGTGLLDYPMADYQDFLAVDGHEEQVVKAVCGALHRRQSEWDLLWLQELPTFSRLRESLPNAARDFGWRVVLEPGSETYSLGLPASWDAFKTILSPNTRGALERKTRKLERDKDARFHRITEADELEEAMEALFRLHVQRWRAVGKPGIFRTPRRRAFDRELAAAFLESGMLDLTLVTTSEGVAGARYSFEYQGVTYFYASGFLPGDEWSRYSLGFVMDGHSIRRAIEAGLYREDFLRGDGEYKRRYGVQEYHNVGLLAAHRIRPLVQYETFRGMRTLAKKTLGPLKRRLRSWS